MHSKNNGREENNHDKLENRAENTWLTEINSYNVDTQLTYTHRDYFYLN